MKCIFEKVTITFLILGLFIGIPELVSADGAKMAILPFKVNSDRDITFLRNGIVDMLSSRLSRAGAVTIIDRRSVASALETIEGEIDEKTAREIGVRLGADHVLFGSITAIGEAVSVDTRVMDVQGTDAAKSFFIQVDSMSDVIPKINRLTGDIGHQVFGQELKADLAQPAPQPVPSHRSHPEKILTQPQQTAPVPIQSSSPFPVSGEQPGEGPFIESLKPQAGAFWRSRTFKLHMNGLAVGDVDGDGRNETVIISDHQIHMYRHEGGQFVKLNETKKDRNRYYSGVDIADINANGRAEIFITALDTYKNKPLSQILEFDGVTFHTLVKESPWYYRVSKSPGRQPLLMGQTPPGTDPFKAPVYLLEWNGVDYEPGQQLVPAKKTNALGCVVGDLQNDGSTTIAAFSQSDAIQIFDDTGEQRSASKDGYGGNLLTVNLNVAGRGDTSPIRYLPMRLIIHDLNGDGRNELVVVKNKDLSSKVLERFRMFTKSKVVGLSWDGVGIGEEWQTRELSGRVADFAVADLEGDGRQDLVLALVSKEGRIIGMKPKANIIAYPLTR